MVSEKYLPEQKVEPDSKLKLELAQARISAFGNVVAAFASRESATRDEVLDLAERLAPVFGAQGELATGAAGQFLAALPDRPATTAAPAVAIENSVTKDKVFCLCCGRGFTMLKRHLKAEHGLTEEQYRAKFQLPEDFPLVAPSYSERKAMYAKRIGLGKYERDKGAEGQYSTI